MILFCLGWVYWKESSFLFLVKVKFLNKLLAVFFFYVNVYLESLFIGSEVVNVVLRIIIMGGFFMYGVLVGWVVLVKELLYDVYGISFGVYIVFV